MKKYLLSLLFFLASFSIFFFEFKVLKEEIHKQLTKLVMVEMFSHRVVVKIKQENAPVFGCRDILGILET